MRNIVFKLCTGLFVSTCLTTGQGMIDKHDHLIKLIKNHSPMQQVLDHAGILSPQLSKEIPHDDDANLAGVWEKNRHLLSNPDIPERKQSSTKQLYSFSEVPSSGIMKSISADSVAIAWVNHYASGLLPSRDAINAVAVDIQGNVYVSGYSDSTYTHINIITQKYTSNGVLLWSKRYVGSGNYEDKPYAIAVDASGNVYVTGTSVGYLTRYDYVTIKYNTNGVQQWVTRYDGPDHDWDIATCIAVDGQGNVYIGGGSYNGNYLYHNGNYDYATVKYDSNGIEQWVTRYNGLLGYDDGINALTLDNQSNIYVTGLSNSSNSADVTTIKYNTNGVQQWIAFYDGPSGYSDEGISIKLDGVGNVYIGGYTVDGPLPDYRNYLTLKYSTSGSFKWSAQYDGPANYYDDVMALAVDNTGNAYVGGASYALSSDIEFATVKYDSNGAEQWVRRENRGQFAMITAIALDPAGNVVVSGPASDYLTVKYKPDGTKLWQANYNGPAGSNDWATGMTIDPLGNILVVGGSRGVNTDIDFAAVKYSPSGTQQWAARYNGAGGSNDNVQAMNVDDAGNVYEVINSNSGTQLDMLLLKYSPDGSTLQSNRISGINASGAFGAKIDRSGNVYLIGGNESDWIITKYNFNGIVQWTALYHVSGMGGGPEGVFTDDSGNVYVIGNTYNTVVGDEWNVIKYNPFGVQQWVTRYNPFPDASQGAFTYYSIAIDENGNVYVVGNGANTSTYRGAVKLDSNGQIIWSKVYSGTGVAIDNNGDVYFAGCSCGTVKYTADGTEQWTIPNQSDGILVDRLGSVFIVFYTEGGTAKYSTDGTQQWSVPEKGYLAVDACGNAYISSIVSSDTDAFGYPNENFLTIKYNPRGEELWRAEYDAFSHSTDAVRGMAVDAQGDVYVAGYSVLGTGIFTATTTLKYTSVPKLTLNQGSIVFDNVNITCTLTDTITLNTGICTTPSSIAVVSDDSNFTVQPIGSSTTPSSPLSFIVNFNPKTGGSKSGQITFTHTASGAATVLAVGGTGIAIPPQYSTQSISFDAEAITVGCKKETTIVVHNKRCAPLNIVSMYSTDSNFNIYVPSKTIASLDSSTFTIGFAPLSTGQHSGGIVFAHDQGILPDTIYVAGNGNGTGSEVIIRDSLGTGWQLLSLPVSVACPLVLANSYEYNGMYVNIDSIVPGIGYWSKLIFPILYFSGQSIDINTISVNTKWNLIGSISTPVAVSQIASDPPGIVTSQFFGYANLYVIADTIYPGKAYWVKVSQAGHLILSTTESMRASNRIRIKPISELPPSPPHSGETQEFKPPIPSHFGLAQNYPNPFNPTTRFNYALPGDAHVLLKIYNVIGQTVATLVDEFQHAGFKSVSYDASRLPSGIYFYQLQAGTYTETKKMLLIK